MTAEPVASPSFRDAATIAYREAEAAGGREWQAATAEERAALVAGRLVYVAGMVESLERAGYAGPGGAIAYLRDAADLDAATDPPSVDGRETPSATGPRPWPTPASGKDPTAALADPWLVEGVLRPGRLMVLAAAEGVGKSYARLELAVRLATAHGALFDHYPIPGPVRVLLVEVENGEEEETRREEEILDRFGLDRSALTDYYTLSIEGLSLVDPEDQRYIGEAIERVAPAVAIFDTGSSMVGEEWGAELKAVVRFLRGLARERGCAVVVSVHLVKPNRQAKRGKDAPAHGQELADVMGQWTRQADSVALMSEAGGRILWRMAKRVPPSTLVLTAEGGAFHALEVAAGEDLGTDTRERVFGCIATGQSDAAAIATYLDVHIRTVRRHVAALRRDGRVTADGPLAVSPDLGSILASVSPGVTRDATPDPTTEAEPLSPGVTVDMDSTGDREGDMSPTPIGEVGDSVTPSPPVTSWCDDYRAHQSQHRRDGSGWVCDACEAMA